MYLGERDCYGYRSWGQLLLDTMARLLMGIVSMLDMLLGKDGCMGKHNC